jgi:hypothetical protein
MSDSALITFVVIAIIVVMIVSASFFSYFAGKKAHQVEQLRFDAHIDTHAQDGEIPTFHYDHLPTYGYGLYVFQVCDLCGERFFETLINPPHVYPY